MAENEIINVIIVIKTQADIKFTCFYFTILFSKTSFTKLLSNL